MRQVAFIGFGEAAYYIAKGLKESGVTDMAAYDVNYKKDASPVMERRAEEAGVLLTEDGKEAWQSARFVLALTNGKVALETADQVLPYLQEGQIYVDMNSASPVVKRKIAEIPHSQGVAICDAAVMATVPKKGHRTPMFLAGGGAKAFAEEMSPYGMNLTVLEADLGGASAIKMIKSVVMKGLPQLMFEAFEAAEQYGVLDTLVQSLNGSLSGQSIEDLANTFIARTMIHAGRRAGEMEDVVSTLKDLGVDPSMSEATVKKLHRLEEEKWADVLGADGGSMDYKSAMKLLIEKRRNEV